MIIKKCENCTSEFETYPCRIGRFCSMKCKGIASRNKISFHCRECNKEFSLSKSRLKFGNGTKYCSWDCWKKQTHAFKYWLGKKRINMVGNNFAIGNIPWNKGKICPEISARLKGKPQPWNKGENNWNWKGDKAKRKDERNDPLYKQWRLKVLRRDDYRCMFCGEVKKGEMQVDHIYSWKDYPRLRYEMRNGQALCRECHGIKTKYQLQKSSDVIFAVIN